MFNGYRPETRADETVKLAKLYKKVKKVITIEDVKEIIGIVYKENNDYLTALTTVMQNNAKAEKKKSKSADKGKE